MSQTSENLLPAASGQDLGSSPSQEWDLNARNVSISGPINLVPEGEGQAGQVVTSGGPGNPAGWSTGGVNIVGGTGISVSTSGSTVTVTNSSPATPASPDTSVQFNDGGVFGGSAGFVWNKTSKNLHVFGIDSSATALQAETYGTAAQTSSSPGLTVGAQYDGSADLLRVRGMYAVAGKDTSDASTVTTAEAVFIDSVYANHGTITNAIGLNINNQTAGTHNYGIKIGDIGNFTANDHAFYSGFGRVTFGGGATDLGTDFFIFDPDGSTPYGAENFQVNKQADVIFGDASTNAANVNHFQFSTSGNFPWLTMSTAGGGAVPRIRLTDTVNEFNLYSNLFTMVNTSSAGTPNTIAFSNATGSAEALTISASSASVGGTGIALELTGAGDGYEKSIALQIDSGGRALCSGGVTLNTSISKPTASSTIRGTLWVVQGAAGVADKIQIVLKDAANAYAWHDITFV